MVRIYRLARTNVGVALYGFRMTDAISPDLATMIGVATGLMANGLGRSFFLWLFMGFLFPLIAPIALIILHLRNPKDESAWIAYRLYQIRSKFWSKRLKPDDFNDQNRDGPAL